MLLLLIATLGHDLRDPLTAIQVGTANFAASDRGFPDTVAELSAFDCIILSSVAQNAISEANKTLRNIRSRYVKEMTAAVEKGKITSYRLNTKVTLELEPERRGK